LSEYQYYEFLAIDRPLDDDEKAAVRSLSTRARISATSFVNEYHWGDFKGDPARLMERYYDAGEFDFDYDPQSLLSSIIGVRAELAAGDVRPLYLAWLAAYGAWERDEDVFDREADDNLEPAVPPGLGTLTAAQRALADFLRLDDDLLTIAAQASPPLEDTADNPDDLAAWLPDLPTAEKDRLLVRVLLGEGVRVRMELLQRYRGDTAPVISDPARRTVADLLDAAARRRADRERRVALQRVEDLRPGAEARRRGTA
jgi:hypothetical protein